MIVSYFDTSVLLSIILDEARHSEALKYWENAALRCSSLLLKIESIISLRRTYERNKHIVPHDWLSKKNSLLNEYLSEVNYHAINARIEQEIVLHPELSQCRTLDAIHIATALRFNTINGVNTVNIYTFDNTMKTLAENFGFFVNKQA